MRINLMDLKLHQLQKENWVTKMLVFFLYSIVKKSLCAQCGQWHRGWYDRKVKVVRDLSCGDRRVYLEFDVRRIFCRKTGLVRQERIPWMANMNLPRFSGHGF